MKKIFVDMDGVLSDFNQYYTKLFGRTPSEVKKDANRHLYGELWDEFVDTQAFAKLQWHAGAKELVAYLNSLTGVQLCVLTSAGGFHRQRHVQAQKMQWLLSRDIMWPAVVVPGRKYKSGFASEDSLILDDTKDVCTDFIAAGGSAIHVQPWLYPGVNVIEEIKLWLQ